VNLGLGHRWDKHFGVLISEGPYKQPRITKNNFGRDMLWGVHNSKRVFLYRRSLYPKFTVFHFKDLYPGGLVIMFHILCKVCVCVILIVVRVTSGGISCVLTLRR
jgi:hypothetical protein